MHPASLAAPQHIWWFVSEKRAKKPNIGRFEFRTTVWVPGCIIRLARKVCRKRRLSYRTSSHHHPLNHILCSSTKHRAEIEVHFQINHRSHYGFVRRQDEYRTAKLKLSLGGALWSVGKYSARKNTFFSFLSFCLLIWDEYRKKNHYGRGEKKYLCSGRCIKLQISIFPHCERSGESILVKSSLGFIIWIYRCCEDAPHQGVLRNLWHVALMSLTPTIPFGSFVSALIRMTIRI